MKQTAGYSTALFLAIVAIFFWFNASYVGPVYPADEIGYLTKASALAGFPIDSSSSYHFGYSLFLVPFFFLHWDPANIWVAAKAVNAAFFGGAAVALFLIARRLYPTFHAIFISAIVLICLIYPAWIGITGYAFSQACFVFFFCIATLFLLSAEDGLKPAILHAIFTAFLFWIHPTGIAAVGASVAIMIWLAATRGKWTLALIVIAIEIVAVVAYIPLDHKLNAAMTATGWPVETHYPGIASALAILDRRDIEQTIIRILGQVAYLSIGTLGCAVLGAYFVVKSTIADRFAFSPTNAIGLFSVISIAGIIVLGSVMFQVDGVTDLKNWMYGRYLEGALLPILLIGVMSLGSITLGGWMFALSLAFAIGLVTYTQPGPILDWVCSAAMWPIGLMPKFNVAIQLFVGAAVTAVAMCLGRLPRAVLFCAASLYGIHQQGYWHRWAYGGQESPLPISSTVRNNWPTGTCVGYDVASVGGHSASSAWRQRIFRFWLYDYNLQRVSFDRWPQDCNGPLMTFRETPPANVKRIAGEKSGLQIWARDQSTD